MSEKTGTDNQVKELKTRCYYTDYVNHMVRFYITCPDTITTAGKRKADIENWMAVQAVFHALKPEEKQMLMDIYNSHYRLTEGVRIYCKEHNIKNDRKLWIFITKFSAAVARRRGLV